MDVVRAALTFKNQHRVQDVRHRYRTISCVVFDWLAAEYFHLIRKDS